MSYDEAVTATIWNTRMTLMEQIHGDGASKEQAMAQVEGLDDEEILFLSREQINSLKFTLGGYADYDPVPLLAHPFEEVL